MIENLLMKTFESQFDVVGIIQTKHYLSEALKNGIVVPQVNYPTMVVLGLAYPKRVIKATTTHLVPSFYTFGTDYHNVLKSRIKLVMKNFPYAYQMGVDNHPHDERLASVVAGLGYFGKNQLIINKDLGTYMFLGIVFIDVEIENEIIGKIDADCGDCRKCINACPTHALSENGYNQAKCISHFNQEKRVLNEDEINSNYSLFGCDICQIVCPKNINKGMITHQEFELSGKELVSIVDLFTASDKVFKDKYSDMAYLWKGKTILMRNALTLMLKQKNNKYNGLIEASLDKTNATWYTETAMKILERLKK